MSFSSNKYLNKVFQAHRIKHPSVKTLVHHYRMKRVEIIRLFQQADGFKGRLARNPFGSGSLKKKTAVNSKFDLDLVVPFKWNAFEKGDYEEKGRAMTDEVRKFLDQTFINQHGGVFRRHQSVATAITFSRKGRKIGIDVVPGLEPFEGAYKNHGDLLLCQHSLDSDEVSMFKTNLRDQLDYLKGHPLEKEVIKLLKIWRNTKAIPLKSFLLEMLTFRAFEQGYISSSDKLTDRVLNTMEYIKDNLEDLHLYDPGNAQNDLMSIMDEDEVEKVCRCLGKFFNKLDHNNTKSVWKAHFPLL